MSVYEIWETGGAYNDSVTPSTYSPEYRSHMVLKILSLTTEGERVFSIGCGNGFIEAELLRARRIVQAIDCNDEAVQLTLGKGVDAFTADFYALPSGYLKGFDVIYADGLLGHVFRPGVELDAFFAKLLSLGLRSGARLVFSNDPPRHPAVDFAPHEHVENFWFLSKDYLARAVGAHGLTNQESYYFPYFRPISGLRNRTICISLADRGRG